ncbi:MAG: D-alanyl-D-alanine carboxypeptidase/D-alanyl-D-alanine-endopeptidase [Candidatus Competibacteraceae bacterium]|nr:D-alanyl-D-alanine carboxypeptidase/D-alanyl-D-alanine-endopeptidase [Candidatus Competibacteraceae bacterium]
MTSLPLRAATLPEPVTRALAAAGLPSDSLGVWVQPLDKDRPRLAFNAGRAFNPASTIKLVTTLAALEILGPDYTWTTRAWSDGRIRGGRLEGDLYLEGRGDPFLVTEYFVKLLRGLRRRGIDTIAGNLLVDNGFLAPREGDSLDGRDHRAYNARPDALLLNFRSLRLEFYPTADRVRVVTDPPLAGLRVDNRLKLTAGRCPGRPPVAARVVAGERGWTLRLSGGYPRACGQGVLYRTVPGEEELIYGVFQALWQELGGRIMGGAARGRVPKEARLLYELQSRPLAELVRGVNKFSNNVMARQLLLTLGAERFGPPGTEAKGRRAVEDWLAGRGLNIPALVLDNGAGLSRQARISPEGLGRLLVAGWQGPWAGEFMASLPIAGRDGTLARRFRGTMADRAHLKTGTLAGVRALAGYVRAASGRRYGVVVMINHPRAARARGVEEAVVEWIYRSG